MTTEGDRRKWVLVGLLTILLATHLAMRVIPAWREMVLPDGRIVLPENDPWFHYREALYTNAHFPAIQRIEDVSRYPEVERVESSGLWDVTLAGIARVAAFGRASPRTVAWVCLLFPPLAGIGVFLLVFRVAAANGPPALGVWLVAWGVLAPGSTLTRTGLGFCDHHVAEMALSLVCLLAVLRLLRRAGDEAARPGWRPAWLEALPLVIFLFTWLGAPIYVLLTALVLALAVIVTMVNGGRARVIAMAGTRLLAGFVIVAAVAAVIWPALVMRRDLFAASLIGAGAAAAMLPAMAWTLETAARRFGAPRSLTVFLLLVAATVATTLAVSPTARAYEGFLLGRKSPLVQENTPVTFALYFKITGLAGLMAIAAPAVGIVTGAWKRSAWLVTVGWSFALLMLWYRTWDYDYLGGLHALVLTGCVLDAIAGEREKSGKPALPALVLGGITTAVAVLALWFGVGGGVYVPAAAYRERVILANAAWRDAMDWLHTQPPPPAADFSRKLPRGRAGVLSGWMWGNLVNTLGGWPAMSARYMDAEAIEPFFREDEATVRAAPLRGSTVAEAVRYVALDASLLGSYFEGALVSSGRKLEDFTGRETFTDRVGRTKIFETRGLHYRAFFAHRLAVDNGAGLQHFRLVYESREETFLRQTFDPKLGRVETWSKTIETSRQREQAAAACAAGFWHEPRGESFAGHIVPSVRLYEQVEGARVVGQAPAGTQVTANIPLRAGSSGRRFDYEQATIADATGAFVLILPYATDATAGSDVQPDGAAEISAATLRRPLIVSDEAVRRGETIEIGEFF